MNANYNYDLDYIWFDDKVTGCSGASCSYTTGAYTTDCLQDGANYQCKVNGAALGHEMAFLWEPGNDTIQRTNWIVKTWD